MGKSTDSFGSAGGMDILKQAGDLYKMMKQPCLYNGLIAILWKLHRCLSILTLRVNSSCI